MSDCGRFLGIGAEDGKVYQILIEDVLGSSDGRKSHGSPCPKVLETLESSVCALNYGFGKYLVAGSQNGSFLVICAFNFIEVEEFYCNLFIYILYRFWRVQPSSKNF